MSQQIQLRNDSTANWESENPVLAQGEIGINTTTKEFKIGDGESTWSELEYFTNGGGMTLPASIKDTDGNDLLVFEKGGTGVARIHAVQDDLALRSARDIILYPGDDGPGHVYIGWGDATIAPNATNKVATIADVEAATGLGNFTFNASTASVDGNQTVYLKALNNTNDVDAQLVLDPDNNAAKIEAYGFEGTSTFYASNSEWTEATWNTNGSISFTESASVFSYITSVADVVARVKVFVNETFVGYYVGTSLGNPVNGLTMTLNGGPTPPAEPVTITQVDFISAFKSKIEVNYDNNAVLIEGKDLDVRISSDDDVFIEARADDVHIRANDDIRFISNWNTDGNPDPEYYWRMNSEGRLTFPGDGYIENPPMSDSETSSKSTFIINPDVTTGNDQYLIVEPTGGEIPHIHIRSGGTVDNSTTNLILGGEMNNVVVSDVGRAVAISSRPALITNNILNENVSNGTELLTEDTAPIMVGYTVNVGGTDYIVDSTSSTGGVMTVTANGAVFTAGTTYTFTYNPPFTYSWIFDSDGVLTGPAMGGLWVTGISGKSEEFPLYVTSPKAVSISGDEGEFLGDTNVPGNQIAKIAYSVVRSSDNLNPITGELTHMGKLLYANQGETLSQFIIPTNDTVAFPIGTEIKFATSSVGAWGISVVDDQNTNLFGESSINTWTTTEFIIPSSAIGTLLKVEEDSWILSSPRLTD